MKGPIFWGMVAVVVLSATAILISARNAEYNRYEISACQRDGGASAYKLDKRTGQTWLILGLKEMNVRKETMAEERARETQNALRQADQFLKDTR